MRLKFEGRVLPCERWLFGGLLRPQPKSDIREHPFSIYRKEQLSWIDTLPFGAWNSACTRKRTHDEGDLLHPTRKFDSTGTPMVMSLILKTFR